MDKFFAQYSEFGYCPTNAPEYEFERLRATRGWKKGTKTYKQHRRAFFSVLLTVTKSPVHRFFTETYYFPAYDPTANPKCEFDRLAEAQKWKPTKRPYKNAEEAFYRAFRLEFGSSVLEFFEEYEEEGFDYNPRSNSEIELDRLAWFKKWMYGTPEWTVALDTFHQAIKTDFNTTFGRNDDDIEGWQYLCIVLGVRGVAPATAAECREVLKDKHCNIYDLLKYVRDGRPKHEPLQFFKSSKELGIYSYTSEPRKVYPATEADRGAIKFVLRRIVEYKKLKRPDDKASQNNGGEEVETEVQEKRPDGEASQNNGGEQVKTEEKENKQEKRRRKKRERKLRRQIEQPDPAKKPDDETSKDNDREQVETETNENKQKKKRGRWRKRKPRHQGEQPDPAPDDTEPSGY